MVKAHVADHVNTGGKLESLTRDGIAEATGVSKGMVSLTATWKTIDEHKRLAKSPASREHAAIEALKKGDHSKMESLQREEQQKNRQYRE